MDDRAEFKRLSLRVRKRVVFAGFVFWLVIAVLLVFGCENSNADTPEIKNVEISNITNNSAIITWDTDKNSTSLVKYGLNESYGFEELNETFAIKHLIKLTELESNTKYHFAVNSTDESNNTNQSKDYTFTTKSEDWIVTENETIENETKIVNGTLIIGNNGYLKLTNATLITKSIIVRKGGIFYSDPSKIISGNLYIDGEYILDNSTLKMNCTYDGQYKIQVNSTGTMKILNGSKVTANESKYPFLFYVVNGAKFEMNNSELHYCGVNETYPGLSIESNNVIIKNSTFSENFNAIYFNSSSVEILNNVIENNYVGLAFNNSNVKINNCTIQNSSEFDFWLGNNSNPNLINCAFDKENEINFTDEKSNLTVKWYLHINITDQEGNPIEGADISVKNKEGKFENFTTNENGTISWVECIEYVQNKTAKLFYTPHTVNASYEGNFSVKSIFMNQSKGINITLEDDIPPKITNVEISKITYNSATITWHTDEPSLSFIKYTDDKFWANWNETEHILELKTSHTFTITNLKYETTYYFILNSTDLYNNFKEYSGEFETSKLPMEKLNVEIIIYKDYFLSNIISNKVNITVSNKTSHLWGANLLFGTIIDGDLSILGEERTNKYGYYIFYYTAPNVTNDTKITFWVNATMSGYDYNNDTRKDIWIRVINVTKTIVVFPNETKLFVLAGIIGHGNLKAKAVDNPTTNDYKNIDVFFEINFTGKEKDLYWINITVNYNENLLPQNIKERNLMIYFWNEKNNGTWEEVDKTGVSVNSNFVWANVSHLTIFAPRDEYASPLFIKEEKPELIFLQDKIELSVEKPKVGDNVTIKVTIKNSGDAIAENIIVKFYVDEKEIESYTIDFLEKGETKELIAQWTTSEGEHNIKVRIEPVLNEKDKTNNEISKIIKVEKEEKEGKGGFPIVIVIPSAIIVILVILFVFKSKLLVGKEKKEEEAEEKEEKIEEKIDKAFELHEKGVELFKEGKHEEAIKKFDEAIKIDTEYEKAWYNKGLVLKKLGRDDEALESFSKAIEIYPEYAKAWYIKGTILQRLYRYEEAIECYENALELSPQLEKAEEVLEYCQKQLEFEEKLPEEVKEKVRLAKGLEVALDFDSAIEIYRELGMDDEVLRVKIEKAKQHEVFNELDLALEVFKEIGAEEHIKRVKKNIAKQLEEKNELDKAIGIYKEIEAIDEINRVKTIIARDFEAKNDFENALKIYEEIGAEEDIKRIKKMQAMEFESIDDFDSALKIYEEIGAEEDIKRIKTMYAVELENLGEYDSAILIYEEIGAIDETKRIKLMLADQFEEIEDFENAAKLYVELQMFDEARRARLNARRPKEERVKPRWKEEQEKELEAKKLEEEKAIEEIEKPTEIEALEIEEFELKEDKKLSHEERKKAKKEEKKLAKLKKKVKKVEEKEIKIEKKKKIKEIPEEDIDM